MAVLACSSAIALTACGGGSSTGSGTSSEGASGETTSGSSGGAGGSGSTEGLKVGMFMATPTNNYVVSLEDAAKAKAAEYGMDLTIIGSNFDVQEQVNQMQLAQQRDQFEYWIVAAISGDQECGAVKAAIAAGIPVYILTGEICGTDGSDYGALGFAGVQTPEAYEEWAEYILGENEPQEFAVVTGPAENDNTRYAEEAFAKAEEKHPGFDNAGIQNTDYTTGKAFQVTQDILQSHPNLGFIASNYAGMTAGVIQAVKAAGKIGKVKIYDLLGDKTITKAIEKGEVAATLPGLPASEAEHAIESVAKAAEGEKVEPSYNPLVELKIKGGPFVTKANVAEFEPQY
ncbi:MAG: sugar ABC transporter substrate-binding protein [Actinobacteria bacterium]|nr:sugar ABC transporter substrate-binding protein [Actinomycetota bacterium]